jgi:hypothetical protein
MRSILFPIALLLATLHGRADAQCNPFGTPCSTLPDLLCGSLPQIGTIWQICHRSGCNAAMPSNMFTLFGGCTSPGVPINPPIACASCAGCEWQALPSYATLVWTWPPRCTGFPIPNDPRIVSATFCIQNVCTDGINPCVCLSDTLKVTIMP